MGWSTRRILGEMAYRKLELNSPLVFPDIVKTTISMICEWAGIRQ